MTESAGFQNRQFQQSLSYSSSCVSASEFFDAEEHDDLKPAEILGADEVRIGEISIVRFGTQIAFFFKICRSFNTFYML